MSENTNPQNLTPARWTAGTVIGMGLLASVAGNIQSILLESGSPSVGALLSAVWWPALLFGMIHLALTIPWGGGFWRAGRWIGPGVIGGLAFYISFFHLAHVLSYYGYDVVSRYAGPLTVDVAMFVATIAWHRVSVAKAAGQAEVATLASQGPVATDEMASLASDWGNLEEELASYVATEQSKPVSAPPAPDAEEPAAAPEPEPAQERATVATLTKVPAEAAKRIQEILEANPSATGVSIAEALMEAGLAGSMKTGRRYAGAVKNGTARVS